MNQKVGALAVCARGVKFKLTEPWKRLGVAAPVPAIPGLWRRAGEGPTQEPSILAPGSWRGSISRNKVEC